MAVDHIQLVLGGKVGRVNPSHGVEGTGHGTRKSLRSATLSGSVHSPLITRKKVPGCVSRKIKCENYQEANFTNILNSCLYSGNGPFEKKCFRQTKWPLIPIAAELKYIGVSLLS